MTKQPPIWKVSSSALILLLLLRSKNYVFLKVKLYKTYTWQSGNMLNVYMIKFSAFQAWLLELCATPSTFSPRWCTGCRAPKVMPGRQIPPYTISTGSPHGSSNPRLRVVPLWTSYKTLESKNCPQEFLLKQIMLVVTRYFCCWISE